MKISCLWRFSDIYVTFIELSGFSVNTFYQTGKHFVYGRGGGTRSHLRLTDTYISPLTPDRRSQQEGVLVIRVHRTLWSWKCVPRSWLQLGSSNFSLFWVACFCNLSDFLPKLFLKCIIAGFSDPGCVCKYVWQIYWPLFVLLFFFPNLSLCGYRMTQIGSTISGVTGLRSVWWTLVMLSPSLLTPGSKCMHGRSAKNKSTHKLK